MNSWNKKEVQKKWSNNKTWTTKEEIKITIECSDEFLTDEEFDSMINTLKNGK